MEKLKREDVKQEVFDLYDDYAHNKLQRREFIEKLSAYAVGGITVASLMSFMIPNYKDTLLVDPNDPDLDSDMITYSSPNGGGEIKGLLSKPKSFEGKLGGIVVVHENRGLNPYIEDTARRAALSGFITLAPDALSPLGGYPGNDDEIMRHLNFKELWTEISQSKQELKNLGIDSILIMPIRRFPNYKLFVDRLCKTLTPNHSAHEYVFECLKKVDFFTRQIDDAVKQKSDEEERTFRRLVGDE